MDEWQTTSLIDIIELISGGTPKTSVKNYWNGDIPWLSVKDFNDDNRYVYSTEKHISQEGLEHSSTKILQRDDIIISARGTLGKMAMIPFPMAFNQSCYGIRGKGCVDQTFLYYLIKNSIRQLKAISHGSVFDTITRDTFSKIYISIPNIGTQKSIAAFLSALDDKIELNNAINKNLEQQAQAIYKRQFIDNKYKISTETAVGDVCSCELGGTPSRNNPEYWNGSIPWINSGEVNRFRITKPSEYITQKGLKYSSTKLLPPKTTVVAITGATLGQVSLLEIECCANQSVVGIIPNEAIPYEFIYPFIQDNIKKLILNQTGGAQQHINKQNIKNFPIQLPTKDVMNSYCNNVSPLYAMITKKCFENEYLSSLRDTLLPKLMSGELDVTNIDI